MEGLSRNPKHPWTKVEESCLVGCLVDLVNADRWRLDNRIFQLDYLSQPVRMLVESILGCKLTPTIMIESRIKLMKRTFQSLAEMRGPTCIGFGWNDELKWVWVRSNMYFNCLMRYIIILTIIFNLFAQTHPIAKGLLNKYFLHYDALSYISEKDCTIGVCVETFVDIKSNVPSDNDEVREKDGLNMEFPTVCSSRMNMSLEDMMVRRPSRSSNARPSLSRSKRKCDM